MEISDRINQKQIEVITTKGYEPEHVYLGRIEIEELINWAKEEFELEASPSSADEIDFLGLKVFEVKTENHLNVA